MGFPKVQFKFASASQFVPLNTPGAPIEFCSPSISLLDGVGEVSISGPHIGGEYPAATAKLTVKQHASPKFTFTVVDASGMDNTYFLAGLALKKGAKPLRLMTDVAGTTFPELEVKADNKTGATTLKLTDVGGAGDFSFWVLVQNSNGDIGLIDPMISNA